MWAIFFFEFSVTPLFPHLTSDSEIEILLPPSDFQTITAQEPIKLQRRKSVRLENQIIEISSDSSPKRPIVKSESYPRNLMFSPNRVVTKMTKMTKSPSFPPVTRKNSFDPYDLTVPKSRKSVRLEIRKIERSRSVSQKK